MTKVAHNESFVKSGNTSLNSEFNLPLQDESLGTGVESEVFTIRKPKRVLHFCDGTLEEFSSDEDTLDCGGDQSAKLVSHVDVSSLEWGPWLVHQTSSIGSKALGTCDYIGEALASFFGITSPKYEYELEEYKKIAAEEEEKQKKMAFELGGWMEPSVKSVEVTQVKSNDRF